MYSIIIPVYNAEKVISATIDSVIAQTYSDWELLLIDDGSKDSSAAICDKYALSDKRIKVFHKENGGVSSARNFGIKKAKGERILFLDSDDHYHSDCLETVHEHYNKDFVIFSFTKCFPNGNTQQKDLLPFQSTTKEDTTNYLLELKRNRHFSDAFCFPWNKVFKTELIHKNNILFPEDIRFREDEIFIYRYIKECKSLAILSDSLHDYTCSTEGLTYCKRSCKEYYLLGDYIVNESKSFDCARFYSIQCRRAIIYYMQAYTLCDDSEQKKKLENKMLTLQKKVGDNNEKRIIQIEPILQFILNGKTHIISIRLLLDALKAIWRLKYKQMNI